MCELANVKTFPELELQFAFSGANVLQLISIVGTEKSPHQTPYSSCKLYSHLSITFQSAKSIWHTFAACMYKKVSKQALTEIPQLSN